MAAAQMFFDQRLPRPAGEPLFRLLGEGLSVLSPVAMALTSALMLTVGVGLLVRRLDGHA